MITHHAEESARREQRVDSAKSSGPDPLPDVPRQDLVVLGHVGPEKSMGQPMVLKRAEQQQAAQGRVAGIAPQDVLGDRPEDLPIVGAAPEASLETRLTIPELALAFEDGPVEIF